MYRDARPSVKAKIDTLEEDLEVAEQELVVLQAQRKPPALLVFPLLALKDGEEEAAET